MFLIILGVRMCLTMIPFLGYSQAKCSRQHIPVTLAQGLAQQSQPFSRLRSEYALILFSQGHHRR